MQFNELEDVPLGTAPEAMEEPLIAVHVERRRFPLHEMTEFPFPRGLWRRRSATRSWTTCTMSACDLRSSMKLGGKSAITL